MTRVHVPGGVCEFLADLERARACGVRVARLPGRGVLRGVLGPLVLALLFPLPLLLPRVLGLRVLLAPWPGVPLGPVPVEVEEFSLKIFSQEKQQVLL